MPANPDNLIPRFQVGDRVTVTLMDIYRGRDGIVTEVIEHKGDYVYRYLVRFTDGSAATFFAFELKLKES